MTGGGATGGGTPASPVASPRFLAAGDRALVVEFGDVIDEALNAAVMALDARLQALALPGLQEVVPTYRSVMIHYDPLVLPAARLQAIAAELAAQPAPVEPPRRVWHVPACYGGAHGMDLVELAAGKGMREEEVVAIHSRAEYRIFMFGFAPGYA
ncbi:MAG: carboxyltransferase domain-containing protein, partial [Alphaproteobacteria bacterium]|nr:carboxyltransferase domain-containing protein [Alphaproteobacteria bacterium]